MKMIHTLLALILLASLACAITLESGVSFKGSKTNYTMGKEYSGMDTIILDTNNLCFDSDCWQLDDGSGLDVLINEQNNTYQWFSELPPSSSQVEHNITGVASSSTFVVEKDDVIVAETSSDSGGNFSYTTSAFSAQTKWVFNLAEYSCSNTTGAASVSISTLGGDIEYIVDVTDIASEVEVFCQGLEASNGDCNYAPRWNVLSVKPYLMVSNATWLQFPYSNESMSSCNVTFEVNKSGSYKVPLNFDPSLADGNLTIINPRRVKSIRTYYRGS